jgi:hypothetical protein
MCLLATRVVPHGHFAGGHQIGSEKPTCKILPSRYPNLASCGCALDVGVVFHATSIEACLAAKQPPVDASALNFHWSLGTWILQK